MFEKGWWLLGFFLLSCLVSATLIWLAARGRDMKKYSGRQMFYADLYRFTVMICTSLALYLVGITPGIWRVLQLPESVVLFGATALPTWVLCSVSGRWYLGWAAAAILQGFVVQALVGMGGGHGEIAPMWWPQVVCDVGGVVLYAMQTGRRNVRVRA